MWLRSRPYLDDKKITRKAAAELVGKERLAEMLKEAKKCFFEDPREQISYYIGRGMLTIQFE